MRMILPRVLLACSLTVMGMTVLSGQNLIPNPGFEQIECPDNPINSIVQTSSWYAINSDAYWLHELCPVEDLYLDAIAVFSDGHFPYRGQGFITLEAALMLNGYFIGEGVGIELKKPLEAGKRYYFEMAAKQLPHYEADAQPGFYCSWPAPRYMEVHTGSDPISIIRQTDPLAVTTAIISNARRVLQDRTSSSEGFEPQEWYLYADCFVATADDTHLAVSANNFLAEEKSNCFQEGKAGAIYVFGHSIDELVLLEIPDSLHGEARICSDGGWVNLGSFIDNELVERATFLWEDGCTDSRRPLRRPGTYHIDMNLGCASVPITLEVVSSQSCLPIAFDQQEWPKSIHDTVILCLNEPPALVDLRSLLPSSLRKEARFEWPDGGLDVSRQIREPGRYEVWAYLPNHCFYFPIVLRAVDLDCAHRIYVPTAFSPNGDGRNDGLRAYISTSWNIKTYLFEVYSHWGALVFRSYDPSLSWSGEADGKTLPAGLYIWKLSIQLDDEQDSRLIRSGEVHLIR